MGDITVEKAEVSDRILVCAESNTDCIALTPDESIDVAMDLLDIAPDDDMVSVPVSDLRLVLNLARHGRSEMDTVARMGGAARYRAAKRSSSKLRQIITEDS